MERAAPNPSLRLAVGGLFGLALAALVGAAFAETTASGIYTCVDANGRRVTSDRPIMACLDREQKQLNRSGTVRKVVPPSYTADERARLEKEQKKLRDKQALVDESRRRNRALLIRYPDQAAHDKERAAALEQIDQAMQAENNRGQTLIEQRKEIDVELEFYQNDISKAPGKLRRALDNNVSQLDTLKRFIDEQTQEKSRVDKRFDEELVRLKELWAQ